MPRLDKRSERPEMISFEFNGGIFDATPGESIGAALTAAGQMVLGTDSHGRGRGMLCGMGACFECRVAVNGITQRACLTPVAEGMRVTSLPYREPLPEHVETKRSVAASESIRCDVAIVGAGPAGMSAAIELAEAGRQVVVLDERPSPGGQFYKQKLSSLSGAGRADAQYRDGAAIIKRLRICGAKLLQGATVWGGFQHSSGALELAATLLAADCSKPVLVTADTLVVAAGAYESVPSFSGWTLPGVMATGAAQGLVRSYRVSPGQRVLIAGNGPLNLQLACELAESGIDVVAVAEAAPAVFPTRIGAALGASIASVPLVARGLQYLATLRRRNVPVIHSHHVLNAGGSDVIENATIAKIDGNGRFIDGSEKSFDVDALCIGYALRPSVELLAALGCRLHERAASIWVPERDQTNQTSIDSVFAIGDGAAIGGAQIAVHEGKLTARAILGREVDRSDVRAMRRRRQFQQHLWTMYRAPEVGQQVNGEVVCRCELVTRSNLETHAGTKVRDINTVKRTSRAGMGVCQGRYCEKGVRAVCASARSDAQPAIRRFTSRVPVKPVNIATIAAEKPEWRGYRETNNLTNAAPANSADSKALAETDVLVVGAGIIGAATAMYTALEGIEVMMIDRGCSNGGASGGNAGSLHLQLLPFDFTAADSRAQSPAVHALRLQHLGIECWRQLEKELGVDIELSMTGGLILADSDAALASLQKKAALEKQVGIDVEILSAAKTRALLPGVGDDIVGAAYCAGEGKLNPLLATPALIDAAQLHGATLSEHTDVLQIEFTRGRYFVTTNRGVISCRRIVNAAGGWAGQIAAMLQTKLPVRAAPQQMLVTQATAPAIPYLLALMGRHLSLKQTANGNVLVGGGWPGEVDPRTGRCVVLRDSVEGNLWAALRVIPRLSGLELIRSWAAMGVMIDGAPIVGAVSRYPGFYTAVGANGYTMGPILGRILAELLAERKSPIDLTPFSIDRFN
jgi:glycine/D-amino acid oxidase-like deaminating enzyme